MSRSQPFGHYDLLDRVAVGGMAEIFRARDRDSGQVCAVKRILPEIAEDDEFVRMFRDEARLARLLDHPNICRILDLGRVDSTYFLALQYVHGHDLRTLFDRMAARGESIPLGFVLHVLQQVCEGLEYAHKKKDASGKPLNLVHRDVSPQNVLVGFDGEVKLIDFGIAKSSIKMSKTQVGTVKGKYAYMSPEQVRGLPLDHRSDIFSLGICMYELLTLKRLFASENELLIMERVKDAELVPPRSVRPDVPAEVSRICMRALARDVDDRYATAADLKADLQAFAFTADLRWTKEDVAKYMRRTFADELTEAELPPASQSPSRNQPSSQSGGPTMGASLSNGNGAQSSGAGGGLVGNRPPGGVLNASPSAVGQEQRMAENKGSDLDVFEGLASKQPSVSRRPTTSAGPPPPPPSARSVPPPPAPPPRRAATQMGIGMPLPPTSSPPQRMSTPPIAPPPSRSPLSAAPASRAAATAPAPAPTQPHGSNPRGAMVDMDWDDEDEKTHVYDKDVVKEMAKASSSAPSGAMPAAPPAPRTPPPPTPPPGAPFKSTMVGMAAPLPPPSRAPTSDRPMPPPPPSRPPPSRNAQFAATAPLPMPTPPPSMPPAVPPGPPLPANNPLAATQIATTNAALSGAPPPPAPQLSAPPQPVSGPQFVPQIQAQAAPMRVADATQVVRPAKGGSGGLIVGGLLFAAAAAIGAYFWASTRPGAIVVNVDLKAPKGTDVVVSIDGSEACKDTTCRQEVKPGAHVIKVTAGDTSSQKTVTVDPGKDLVVPVSIEVADKKTVLKLSSSQSGVKVSVDTNDPESLPLVDDAIKPGKHHLKFTGPNDHYKAVEQDVTLDEGDTKSIDDVKLPLSSVSMKFTFPEKGERASLNDGSKKIDLKDDGKAIDLDPSKTYTISATAPGYEDLKDSPLKLGDDAEQSHAIELVEKGKPTVAMNNPPPTPNTNTATPPPPPPPNTGGGDGSLFVNTLPKSNCVVGGTPRGATPFTIKLAPGSYTVTCVAKDDDGNVLKKSASANVTAGGKATVTLKLRD